MSGDDDATDDGATAVVRISDACVMAARRRRSMCFSDPQSVTLPDTGTSDAQQRA